MSDQAKLERALARQSVIHHRKREEQLERLLEELMAHAKKDCKGACRQLRELAAELGD